MYIRYSMSIELNIIRHYKNLFLSLIAPVLLSWLRQMEAKRRSAGALNMPDGKSDELVKL